LKACQNYLKSGTLQAQSEADRAEVLNKLEETKNMTAFYMNMQRLERTEVNSRKPLYRRRYGRRVA
jgi:hypothetical protein